MSTPTYEQRLEQLSRINATHLRNIILRNDDAALEVASHIGRYISDIAIVDVLRSALKGDKDKLHEIVMDIVNSSIGIVAENKAESQAEKYGGTAADVAKLLADAPMCKADICAKLMISPDRLTEILHSIGARVVDWGNKDGAVIRLYGMPEKKVAA